MKASIRSSVIVCLLAGAVAFSPGAGFAQDKKPTGKPGTGAAETKPETKAPVAGAKTQGVIPFRGKVDAVDKNAKTVKVGERVFQITSETRLEKNGKPATLDDAVVGDEVGGNYRTGDDGKLNAMMVRFGPKPAMDKPQGGKPGTQGKKDGGVPGADQ